jgi:hypothetical protein
MEAATSRYPSAAFRRAVERLRVGVAGQGKHGYGARKRRLIGGSGRHGPHRLAHHGEVVGRKGIGTVNIP